MWSVNEVALVRVDVDEKVLGLSSLAYRIGGVAAPGFRVLVGRPERGERDHRYLSTISRSCVCRPWTCNDDPRFLRRPGAHSATRRERAAICRGLLIENPKARVAYLGDCGRIPAIPYRPRRLHRWSEFGSTDPTQEQSAALLLRISFNAFRIQNAFCEGRHG
jgi:hypothetical protein